MKHVIIDTDAGIDDALAIIFALKSPELRVEAITTVAGNVEVEKCTRNCLLLLDILQPACTPVVAQGARRPLKRELVTAPEVHGEDGLGNATQYYPLPRSKPAKESAIHVILDLVKKYQRKLTIIALGPLTNLALAVQEDLRTMRNVGEVVAMGGAFQAPGNTGPVAEFNMFVDPDAAQLVLEARLPITLLPLDITERAILYRNQVLDRRKNAQGELGEFIARFTRVYMKYHKETEGFDGGYLHDPLAVGAAIKRSLVKCGDLHVEVETLSQTCRGMTVAEEGSGQGKQRSNVRVASALREPEFLKLFQSAVWS